VAVVGPGCARPGAAERQAPLEDQRVLPKILRQQERRVAAARQKVDDAEEELYALRLRQRMLAQHGRPDLARALDADVATHEHNVARDRQQVADEEAALDAYRAYAARLGVGSGGVGP